MAIPTPSFQRKYPRRALNSKVGILTKAVYSICECNELGEGGMSITTSKPLLKDQRLVVTFRVPKGSFVNLQATVKSVRVESGKNVQGISFDSIEFVHKRQIRAFVASRKVEEIRTAAGF